MFLLNIQQKTNTIKYLLLLVELLIPEQIFETHKFKCLVEQLMLLLK